MASRRRVVTGRNGRPRADRRLALEATAEQSGDPFHLRVVIPRSRSTRPERALTGGRGGCGAVLRAIRRPNTQRWTASPPPAFEFSAANASGTAHDGDELPAAGGPVRLRVRSNAPAWFTAAIRNGSEMLSGEHHEPEFTVEAPGGAGVYWVEIRAAGTPWLTSNPIYVRAADPAARTSERQRPPASQTQPLIGGPSKTTWRVEHDATSLAAVDLPDSAWPGWNAGQPGAAALRSRQWTGRPAVRRARRGSFSGSSQGATAWCSRAAPSSPCESRSSSARMGKLAAVGLRRYGGSGAHRVFDDLTPAAGPARTSLPGPNPRHPVRRGCCQHQTRHVGPRVITRSGVAAVSRQVRAVNTM
jgi:hypothetical protein